MVLPIFSKRPTVFPIFTRVDHRITPSNPIRFFEELLTINAGGFTYIDWGMHIFLSMMAILLLPRQFQVIVVENVNEEHLKKAIWLFPLYLLAINIFVLPVAFAGMLQFAAGSVDADYLLA